MSDTADNHRTRRQCRCVYMFFVTMLGLVVWLAADTAHAARGFGVVTLDLRPEAGEVPTHLCVVSQAPGPRARKTLKDLVVANGSGEVSSWQLRPEAWGGRPEQQSCAGPGGQCVPQVELPASAERALSLPVACTTDALLPADVIALKPRMVVMMLDHLEGSPPIIESLKLTGGVATVGVEADLQRVVVTARSLGGHYLPQRRSQRAEGGSSENKLVVVPLQPRCQWVDLNTPYGRLRERDRGRLDVYVHGEQVDTQACVGPMRGTSRVAVRVARVGAGEPGSLELDLRADKHVGESARFGSSYSGPWPAKMVQLHATQIPLVWRPPACVVADDFCPRVTLETGVTCSGRREADACHYTCPGETDQHSLDAISPPLTVHFEKQNPGQRWSEILTRVGQPLTSYVTGDKVYVHADISSWKLNVPGARVEGIEFLGDDGSVRRFPLHGREEIELALPEASCGPVRYRMVGDRKYVERTAEIRGGQLLLAPPEDSTRVLTFNLSLLQGGSWALSPGAPDELKTPAYFLGLAQVAANFRPKNPKYARLSGELRLGGSIGQWGYFGDETLTEEVRRVDRKLAWVRFLFEPALVVDVVHPVALSFGVGIGASWPIRVADVEFTNRFSLIVAPSLDARFAIRKWISLMVRGQVILGERTQATLVEDTVAVRRELSTVTLAGLYGLLFSF